MIIMSKKQIKALKTIKKYNNLERVLNTLDYSLDDYIEFQSLFLNCLECMIFSDNNFDGNTTVELTELAYSIIEKSNREYFRFWFPVVISILALIVSTVRLFY